MPGWPIFRIPRHEERPMKNAPVRHRLEQIAYRGVTLALQLLPQSAARGLGRALGGLAWAILGSRRRVAVDNLALAFPALAPAARRRTARASFANLGAALTDTLWANRLDLPELCRRLSFEGWDHLATARREHAGLFVLSAHLGQWEIAAYVAGVYFGPLNVVGRPLDNPYLDRDLTALRGRFGNRGIPKRGAARGMLKAVAAGEIAGILIDQRVRPGEGIELPFFGHPSPSSPLLARLSIRTGAPVVPIFCYPEPRGRYRFVARPAIHPEGADDGDEAVAALTRRYLEATESEIRGHPERWMWMHRRWKR
jgi:Kdo2-lipid IVA lauroyltransferase/acyltransferase